MASWHLPTCELGKNCKCDRDFFQCPKCGSTDLCWAGCNEGCCGSKTCGEVGCGYDDLNDCSQYRLRLPEKIK